MQKHTIRKYLNEIKRSDILVTDKWCFYLTIDSGRRPL